MSRAVAILAAAAFLASCSRGSDDSAATTTSTSSTTTTTIAGERPLEAARSFALAMLGFVDPVIGEFRQGDSRSGEVPVRPRADGPETIVLVRQIDDGTTWSVIGATTADIEVTRPPPNATIASPVAVAGRARAFEGTVQVRVRADGRSEPIGTGHVLGGGDELRPFEGAVEFDAQGAGDGFVVFYSEGGEDFHPWQASAVRVFFAKR